MKNIISFLLLVLITTTSCSNDNNVELNPNQTVFGIFKVSKDKKSIEMNGTIGSSSLVNFNKLYTLHPTVTKINIKNCDGSSDDDVNLLLSKKVYDLNIEIHLLDNAVITSGGVDFFLAGKEETEQK